MLITRAACLAVLSAGLLGTSVLAQTSSDPVKPNRLDRETKEIPPLNSVDLSVEGSATIRELRFESEPKSRIRFWGTPHRHADWVTERQNIPKDVEPGVTYRNVGIKITIFSIFDNEAIVEEAVGDYSNTKPEVSPTP